MRMVMQVSSAMRCDEVARDVFLGRFGPILDAVGGDEVDAVARAAHDVARHVVGDDPVGALGGALGGGIGDDVVGLGGEADQQARAVGMLRRAWRGCRGWARSASCGGPSAFLSLCAARLDPPVGDRGDQDRGVAGQGAARPRRPSRCAVSTSIRATPPGWAARPGRRPASRARRRRRRRRRWRSPACPTSGWR